MSESSAGVSAAPDAEAAYASLLAGVRERAARGKPVLVGIHSGGAWVAQRLADDLAAEGLVLAVGFLSSAFHRDDYTHRGLPNDMKATALPFSIDEADVILVDDILFTGRTVRAALNELFDFGRPRSVTLAVLLDRGGRELPIAPDHCGVCHPLPPERKFRLAQDPESRLFSLTLN